MADTRTKAAYLTRATHNRMRVAAIALGCPVYEVIERACLEWLQAWEAAYANEPRPVFTQGEAVSPRPRQT